MNHCFRRPFFLFLFLFAGTIMIPEARSVQAQTTLNVYLDCSGNCYASYIRTNIEFVNYVRDQDDADLYLRITSASTGTGREYTMDFRGMGLYSSRRDTLIYHSLNTDSSDERRADLVRRLALGLIPFMADADLLDDLMVLYESSGARDQTVTLSDPWNSWIFDTRLGSSFDMEDKETNFGLDGRISAERITHDWKIESRVMVLPERRTIELSDGKRRVNRDRAFFDASVVRSIGDHFAVGIFGGFDYSERQNTKYEYELAPAFEYSYYPYSEFQERRIFVQYRIAPSHRIYDEITIFGKNSETIVRQSLSIQARYDQPWGRIDIRLSGANYFHNMSINRLTIDPSLNIRLTRSLSFNISSRYRAINDQISLRASDPDDIDLLLGQRQQATTYDFRLNFGISYTFGSIFSGAVNPRL